MYFQTTNLIVKAYHLIHRILKVNYDTNQTVSHLEDIIESSNTLHREKIDEFVQEISISNNSGLFEKLLS